MVIRKLSALVLAVVSDVLFAGAAVGAVRGDPRRVSLADFPGWGCANVAVVLPNQFAKDPWVATNNRGGVVRGDVFGRRSGAS